MQLPIVLHIGEADGVLSTTLDSPDQGAFGIPTGSTEVRNDSVFVGIPAIGGQIDAAIAADSLRGTFSQNGQSFDVVFGPAEPLRRPQTPEAPFPYTTEDVEVESAPGVTLAGTLTSPEGYGPFPIVVLLTGSGPQDRDEALFEHKPFAVLADALAREGIASVRFDDRGQGGSTGEFSTATLDDFLIDARAMLSVADEWENRSTMGLLGHSEGGLTALRLANDVDFVVTLAGPMVLGADVYVEQMALQASASGADSTASVQFGESIRAAMAPMFADPGAPTDSLLAATMSAFNAALIPMNTGERMKLGLSGPAYPQVREAISTSILSPGFRSFALFDPSETLAEVDTPVLALFGGLDTQVAASQSAPVAEAALAGDAGSLVRVFDKANHLFQRAETGAVTEYGKIEETMDPAVLDQISAWINGIASR